MEYLHKKTIFILLGTSFVLSILSDLIYGNIALAEEYMVGMFISGLSQLSMSLAIVLAILYLMIRVIFKDYINQMFRYHDWKYREEAPKSKKAPTIKKKKGVVKDGR